MPAGDRSSARSSSTGITLSKLPLACCSSALQSVESASKLNHQGRSMVLSATNVAHHAAGQVHQLVHCWERLQRINTGGTPLVVIVPATQQCHCQ
jgi:hypothetical protein